MRAHLGLLAVLGLAACGDDGGAPIDSGPHIDAPADAPLDADPSLAPLIGTWVKATDSWSGQQIEMVTFRADGTMSIGSAASADMGTYTVPSAGRVKLVTATTSLETGFVIGNNHLLLTASLPQGTVTGLVGTWNATVVNNNVSSTTSIVVAANNTAAYTVNGPSGSMTYNGTWVAEGTGLVYTVTTPLALTLHFRPIGAQAIGTQLFMKQ